MICRHVMLAVPSVDYVSSNVVDRVGRIVRGLHAELELFSSIYEPDKFRPGHYDEPAPVIAGLVEETHRRLERIADMFREQSVTVRCSVRWDYPVYEAVVRQVLRHQVDLLVVPARATGVIGARTLHYREARLIETCPCPLLLLKSPEVEAPHAYEVHAGLDERIIAAVLDGVSCEVLVVKPREFTCSVDQEPAPAVPLPGLERSQ